MEHLAPPSAEPRQAQPVDDQAAARLAALTQRRTGAPRNGAAAAPPQRRRHPAKGARVAALGLSLISTGGLATLFALTTTPAGVEVQAASIVSGSSTSSTSSTSLNPASTIDSAASATTPAPTVSPTAAPAATASPAVVDGAVFHNKWGDVQVEATFAADGTLTDVVALQTPYVDNKSVRINAGAVPRLITEALTAQSANVDTVSGATYTSADYRRSLQSAVDAARDAGLTTLA